MTATVQQLEVVVAGCLGWKLLGDHFWGRSGEVVSRNYLGYVTVPDRLPELFAWLSERSMVVSICRLGGVYHVRADSADDQFAEASGEQLQLALARLVPAVDWRVGTR